MNTEQTRQLGIEFERRIQTMLPQKEFIDKLDTETIYSFLNQYQDKYIHELFNNLDKLSENKSMDIRIGEILSPLLTTIDLIKDIENSTALIDYYNLENDFSMYVRSVSKVNSFYRYKYRGVDSLDSKTVSNQYISNIDLKNYIEGPNDTLRILRVPIVSIDNGKLVVIHDRYTNITGESLTYYRTPKYFTPLETNADCELPIDAFEDLVSGAIQLYVQYVAGQTNNNKKEQKEQDND